MEQKSEGRLHETLLEGPHLSDIQKRILVDYRRSAGGTLSELVVRLGFLTEEQVHRLADGPGPVPVTPAAVVRTLLAAVPAKLLLGYRVVPISFEGAHVIAAEEAELEPLVREELWNLFGKRLPVVQAVPGTVVATLRALGCSSPEPGDAGPELGLKDLIGVLLRKGVIDEDDLRQACGTARGAVPPSAR